MKSLYYIISIFTTLAFLASSADAITKEEWENKVVAVLGEVHTCFKDGSGPLGSVPSSQNCNVFVGRAMTTIYNLKDFQSSKQAGMYLSANEVYSAVLASAAWRSLGACSDQAVLDSASAEANSGRPVLAVWKNPDPKLSGHVTLVGPGPMTFSSKWGKRVPNSASFFKDAPAQNFIGKPLSEAFGADKRDNVVIFVHN